MPVAPLVHTPGCHAHRALLSSLVALLSGGCSNFAGPHHPYAPLLDRAGAVDVAVAVGGDALTVPTLSAHAAVAPVDHLVVAAGLDMDLVDEGNGTQRVAGELAVGAFVMEEPELRAELLAGVGGGYATGERTYEDRDEDELEGVYARPFVQATTAGVWDFFTWGGGVRFGMTVAEISVTPRELGAPPPSRRLAMQGHVEPFTTFRFRIDIVELDLTLGGSYSFDAHSLVGPELNLFGTFTFRVRFRAWDDAAQVPASPPSAL